jgi:hypothetical protein
MPQQIEWTQGPGKCCKKVGRWILRTRNGEIPWITELPVGLTIILFKNWQVWGPAQFWIFPAGKSTIGANF